MGLPEGEERERRTENHFFFIGLGSSHQANNHQELSKAMERYRPSNSES